MREEKPEYNLFMVCNSLNVSSATEIPSGFHVRCCPPFLLLHLQPFLKSKSSVI